MTDGRFLKESAITDDVIIKIKKLSLHAEQRGETLAQMALKWVLSKKDIVSVLVGASKPEQIRDNIKAASGSYFTDEELSIIDSICDL